MPGLARWLLALGILATLAANVAHGWSHGPVGAAVAAWPAASLVGSYDSCSGSSGPLPLAPWSANRPRTTALDQWTSQSPDCGWSLPGIRICRGMRAARGDTVAMVVRVTVAPVQSLARAGPADQMSLARIVNTGSRPRRRPAGPTWTEPTPSAKGAKDIDEAAVAAYRASIDSGRPLSERKLAALFGKTSRRWARHRMAEAMGRAVG